MVWQLSLSPHETVSPGVHEVVWLLTTVFRYVCVHVRAIWLCSPVEHDTLMVGREDKHVSG